MGRTGISWTDVTWNPVRGCSRVSEGCRHCYAEVQAARIVRMAKGKPSPYDGLVKLVRTPASPASRSLDSGREARWTGEVRLIPEHLADPLRWSKPRRVFVNSMSDLFHESLADEDIDLVFAVMLLSPRHTFQVLTKRAARMRAYMTDPALYDRVLRAAGVFRAERPELNQIGIDNPATCPRPWIWLGVSVESQDEESRIDDLRRTPAAVRFISGEPLLGPLLIERHLLRNSQYPHEWRPPLDWVIAGCESGPRARPCSVEWLRSLRDQCAAAGVPFFLKQAVPPVPAQWMPPNEHGTQHQVVASGDGSKRKPGGVIELPYLDGVQHAAFPEGTGR